MYTKKNLLIVDRHAGKVHRRKSIPFTADENRRRIVMGVTAAILAIVGVVVIFWGIISMITEIIQPEKNVEPEEQSEAERLYDDTDALCLLVMKLSDDRSQPEMSMLARFEPSEQKVYVTGLPATLRIDGRSLADYYAADGAAGAESAVARLIGVESVSSVGFTFSDIQQIIKIFDTVTVTVPYPIDYDCPYNINRNIHTAAGTREWTGGELARLLNYPEWPGGEIEHLGMYTQVLVTLINENVDWKDEEKMKSDYLELGAVSDLDMPMGVYHRVNPGLLYLASCNTDGHLAVDMNTLPTDMGDGTSVYQGESLEKLLLVFGSRGINEE